MHAANLEILRRGMNLTQLEIAQLLGVCTTQYCLWECGVKTMDNQLAEEILTECWNLKEWQQARIKKILKDHGPLITIKFILFGKE